LSVLTGRLALRVGDTDLELATGDTAMFEAHAPHRYACAGSEVVRFTMVVLDPGDPDLVPPTSIAPAAPDRNRTAGLPTRPANPDAGRPTGPWLRKAGTWLGIRSPEAVTCATPSRSGPPGTR